MKYLFLGLAIAFTLLFLVLRVTKGGLAGLFSKIVASFAFMTLGLYGLITGTHTNLLAGFFIILGLLCGFVGDIVLDLKVIYPEQNDPYLNSGMLSFGIGHVFYFVAAMLLAKGNVNVLVPLIAAGVAGLIMTPAINIGGKKTMKLNFGKFLWQAVAYTFELVFMGTLLICFTIQNAKYLLFALGILLIFVSDMFLSMNYFQEGQANNKPVVFLNHIIYYAGQILIALFIFLI